MKKKLQFLFSMVALFLVALSMQAQTDVTATYVKNADLSADVTATDNGWTCAWRQDYQQATDAEHVNVVEFYAGWGSLEHSEFSLSQEIELPAGNYRIAVNAFYREGDGAGDGTNKDKAYIFAGDKKQNVFPLTSLAAFKAGGTAGGSGDLQKASNAFYQGEFSNAFDFTVEAEEGQTVKVNIGFAGKFTQNRSWVILGPVKLYQYTIDDYRADYKKAVAAIDPSLFSAKMSSAAMLSLEDAANVDVDAMDDVDDVTDAIRDLTQAVSAAEQSVILYSKVKKALDDYATMAAALDADGQAAYDVSSIQNAYDDGTFDTDQTPAIALAYANAVKSQTTAGTDMTGAIANAAGNAAVGADNWQLANALAEGEEFRLDTWAGTASGMSTPHIEYWHVKGTNLSDNTISQTIEGLTPGTYTVTATTAVNNENNVALEAGSAIFFANDAEADITEVVDGVSTATDFSGTTGTFSVEATVADDGELTIGFTVAGANYNWLAFKDVTLTLVAVTPKEAKLADLDKSLYHLWTGYDAEATIADPDNANCDYVLNSETGCVYGNSNINAGTATQFADLGDWDYLTIVAASGAPRLFFNQNDANNILVYANDANYVVSNEDGVIIYDLAKFKADKGFVHLNAIKASAYNTSVNVEEMMLATVTPYVPAPKYDITIAAGIENGSVAVKGGAKKAAEGAEVTLEATPDGIYELDAYSVTYVDGEETKDVEVSEGGVFVMPAFPVTVSATFKESAAPIEPDAWFVEDNFRVVDYKGVEDGGRIEKDGDGNYIRMIPRFEVENKTTGNGSIVITTGNNAGADYWSQFWVKVSDTPMTSESTPIALSFRVRADRAQTIATQGHGVDWDYDNASSGYLGFGNVDVTTEWKKVTLKVDASSGHPSNFVSVVFNLSEQGGTSNNFYFDDFVIEEGFKADWYYAQEIRAKDYYKENESDPDPTYTDTDTPHPLARFVADEEGGYVQVVSNANPSQPYNSQIWIQIPDEWVGKTTKMTYEVMADKVVSAPESYQATATGKGWGANAAPSATAKLEITEADKWITITRILNTEGVKSNGGAPYPSRQVDQYCLDLSNDPAAITYKFRNIKFEVAYEDWWENNMITLAGSTDKVPFTPGAGEEGGYVQVAPTSDTQILFELPEAMQAKKVVVSMTVKASAEGSAAAESGDGIDFTTEWNDVSAVFDPVKAGSTKYTLNLAAGTTYYFDNLAFELAPVEYEEPDLAETEKWYQDLAAQGIKFISHEEPAYSLGGEDKPMRYVKGDGPEGDYMEFVGKSGCSNRWESQAFIDLASVDEPLPDGTEVTIMMKIKANAATTCDTQAQNQAVGYLRMNLFDKVPFTTGWTTYSCTKVLDKISTNNNGDQPVTRISIDIGAAESYTCQFDDVVITITKPIDPSNFEWAETITNGEIAEGGDMSEFIVKDPDENFTQAEQRDKFGASGEEGDFGIRVKTEDVAADAPAHSYQFFVRLPYALPAGTKYWVNFDYKYNDQEKALAVSTQAQEEPGDYLGNMFGNVSFTSDYTSFEKAGEVTEDQAGMRSIAFNLSGNKEGKIFRFDNVSVKVLKDDVDALAAYTADWDAVSASKEPLKDAIKAGNAIVEEEGFATKYTAESAQALTDALALGATANIKIAAALADADSKAASIQAMEDATKAINDAIAGLTISEDYYIPMPDLTENFVKVPETPAVGFGNTDKESGAYDGDAYTNYIATGTSIAFKMLNEDVTGCDKIYIYLAQPLKAGWNIAFWGVEGVEGVKALEAGTEVIEFDLTEELGGVSAVKEENGKTLLKEITLIYLWGAQTPLEAKVYGVYKHLTDEAVGIAEVDDDATETKARKYIENGQIVIVKDGKKYNAAGVEIE